MIEIEPNNDKKKHISEDNQEMHNHVAAARLFGVTRRRRNEEQIRTKQTLVMKLSTTHKENCIREAALALSLPQAIIKVLQTT